MNAPNAMGKKRFAGMLLAGAMLAGIAAMPAMAQEEGMPPAGAPAGQGHRGEAAEHMKEMSDKLGLTPEQQDVFRKSMMDERTKLTALRDDTSTDRKDKRKQMMQIRSDASATRRAALTEDQKPKYDAMEAEMREHMRDRRKGGGAGDDAGGPPPPPPPPPAQ